MKKQTAKKAAAKAPAKTPVKKTVAKAAAKAPATKAPAKKAPAAKGKKAPEKKSGCGGACTCGKDQPFCIESLISEIFNQLADTENLATLMKDYFFTELLKRGMEEAVANAIANKLIVEIGSFEANIDIVED